MARRAVVAVVAIGAKWEAVLRAVLALMALVLPAVRARTTRRQPIPICRLAVVVAVPENQDTTRLVLLLVTRGAEEMDCRVISMGRTPTMVVAAAAEPGRMQIERVDLAAEERAAGSIAARLSNRGGMES